MEGRRLFMKTLGSCKTPGRAPNGPKLDTWSNGPKDGVAAPWQILDADLFRRFLLILKGLCNTLNFEFFGNRAKMI